MKRRLILSASFVDACQPLTSTSQSIIPAAASTVSVRCAAQLVPLFTTTSLYIGHQHAASGNKDEGTAIIETKGLSLMLTTGWTFK